MSGKNLKIDFVIIHEGDNIELNSTTLKNALQKIANRKATSPDWVLDILMTLPNRLARTDDLRQNSCHQK